MSSAEQERTGELMILGQALIYGFFPVMLSYSGGKIPPFFFAGVSSCISGCVIGSLLIASRKTSELRHPKALPDIFKLTFFIGLAYCFLYLGGSQTTGINISILSQAEIVFTFFFAGLFFGEEMPPKKILAGLFVLHGTLMIVYNGVLHLNPGDLMILLATAIFPFGNRYAKKSMEHVSPQTVLTIRSFLTGFSFLLLSALLEPAIYAPVELLKTHWLLFLVNGMLIFSITKVMWYEGLKRIDLSKAITLGMSFTAFGVLYSMLFLQEVPTFYQALGFVVVMTGVFIITQKTRPSELTPVLDT